MFRFSIRDLLWVMVIAGLAALWYTERRERTRLVREQATMRVRQMIMQREVASLKTSEQLIRKQYESAIAGHQAFLEHARAKLKDFLDVEKQDFMGLMKNDFRDRNRKDFLDLE
jgi:hypothetical protein